MFELNERVALVTGASGGLGGDIARFLHKQGAYVILTGTNVLALQELEAQLSERVHILPCRLTDKPSVEKFIEDAQNVAGKIDILVNNAGITRDNLLLRMKDEEWDEVLNLNLKATFWLTRGFLRGMVKRRFGRIINISSVVGVTGNAGQANYAASKSALFGFTKSVALEVAGPHRDITANCIAPGIIDTPMTEDLPDKQKEKILSITPMGRIGYGADIAAGVVYFASDEASFVTGHVLNINGGMAMI